MGSLMFIAHFTLSPIGVAIWGQDNCFGMEGQVGGSDSDHYSLTAESVLQALTCLDDSVLN